jgi:hypothetical protein
MADVIKRIHSKGPFTQEEYKAAESGIYPGMQVKLDSNGELVKHSTSGGAIGDERMFAMEDQIQGKTVDDVYADDSIVTVIIPYLGCEINMLLLDDEVVEIGDKIMAGGAGQVKENSGGSSILGIATGALDLSTSAALADALVPVRITAN